jgi:hypothetical protein
MIQVAKIEQTCTSCPSQFEGTTSDGKYVYARYRFGTLVVEIDNQEILSQTVGQPLDGYMPYHDIVKRTEGLIAWPETCKGMSE